jgi:hypothetical protein
VGVVIAGNAVCAPVDELQEQFGCDERAILAAGGLDQLDWSRCPSSCWGGDSDYHYSSYWVGGGRYFWRKSDTGVPSEAFPFLEHRSGTVNIGRYGSSTPRNQDDVGYIGFFWNTQYCGIGRAERNRYPDTYTDADPYWRFRSDQSLINPWMCQAIHDAPDCSPPEDYFMIGGQVMFIGDPLADRDQYIPYSEVDEYGIRPETYDYFFGQHMPGTPEREDAERFVREVLLPLLRRAQQIEGGSPEDPAREVDHDRLNEALVNLPTSFDDLELEAQYDLMRGRIRFDWGYNDPEDTAILYDSFMRGGNIYYGQIFSSGESSSTHRMRNEIEEWFSEQQADLGNEDLVRTLELADLRLQALQDVLSLSHARPTILLMPVPPDELRVRPQQ